MRRKLHNLVQELRGNIRVFARCRPFLPSDSNSNGGSNSNCTGGSTAVTTQEKNTVITNIETNSVRICRTSDDNKVEETQFQFDKVCIYIPYIACIAYIYCVYTKFSTV